MDKIRKETLEVYDHQEIPFEKILEAVVKERDLSRSPLFQAMFSLAHHERANLSEIHLSTLSVFPEKIYNNTTLFELSISVIQTDDILKINLEYCTDLFNADTAERLLKH